MRRVAVVLACLCLSSAARADDPPAEERAFVEVTAARDRVFVHEPIRIRLRIGFEREYFRTNAVSLFRQQMDVPVHVKAPWLRELPGTVALDDGPVDPASDRERLRLALDDDVVEAVRVEDHVRDGRAFTVLEIEKRYLPVSPGEIVIPAPTLRFAYATRFEEDFVAGRVPVDRRDAFVHGAPLVLRIQALPEEGRPPEFGGAVGRYTVAADADRTGIETGGILRLVLRIEGEGNLETLEPPRLDRLPGFHVYGSIDDKSRGRRTVTYEIAPIRDDVTQVPSIPFAFFDPGPPSGYRIVRTKPIPLDVRTRGGAAGPEPVPGEVPTTVLLAAALLVVILGAFLTRVGLRRRRRARKGDRVDYDLTRVRVASTALRAHPGQPGPDLADAFAEFLAACLCCSPAAVIAQDLRARLARAGVPAGLAARAAATMERLVAAHYSGESDDRAEVVDPSLIDEIEATQTGSGVFRPPS